MTVDEARGRVVIVGGDNITLTSDVWEVDGVAARRRDTAPFAPRWMSGIAFDAARSRVVLFGGEDGSDRKNDTWEYDGVTWSAGPAAPAGLTPRSRPAMAYHRGLGRVVLLGGSNFGNDTWLYDGSSWLAGPSAPAGMAGRSAGAMAHDGARGRVVLTGGARSNGDAIGDAWELDAAAGWVAGVAPPWPNGLAGHAMAYDATLARLVVWGGWYRDPLSGYLVSSRTTWALSGSSWQQVGQAPVDLPAEVLASYHLAHDPSRGRMILLAPSLEPGNARGEILLWEHDGSAWLRSLEGPQMEPMLHHAMAWDERRSRAVVVGGPGRETWTYDGIRWGHDVDAPEDLEGRQRHAMAYDAARDRVVLFGGQASGGDMDDTWELDGAGWHAGPIAPAGLLRRSGHAMAFDPRRQVTVLFGGVFVSSYPLQDTWEYDGQAWSPGATGPAARFDHALASDPSSDGVVMFGGADDASMLDDAWRYDGQWSPLASGPPASLGSRMALDPQRGKVIAFGGTQGGPTFFDDTWELDPGGWAAGPAAPPGLDGRAYHAMASFPGGILLLGGQEANYQGTTDVWEYECVALSPPTLPPGDVGAAYAATVAASGGTPPYAFVVVAGALPPGLALSSSGQISGTPSAAGCFDLLVKAADGSGCAGSTPYRLQIGSCCLQLPYDLPVAVLGDVYDRTIGVDGGAAPYAIQLVAGTLPPGIVLEPGGMLAGTPGAEGSYPFSIAVTDAGGCQLTRSYTLEVKRLPASFDAYPVIGPAPMVVTFQAEEGPDIGLFRWDLGDGTTLTYPDTGLTHGYYVPGLYTVTLTVSAGTASETITRTNLVLVTSGTEFDHVILAPGPGLGQPSTLFCVTPDGRTGTSVASVDGSPHYGTNVAGGAIRTAGSDDILTGVGPGPVYGPRVRAFAPDGTFIAKVNFFAYGTLRWGTNVASGDLEGDGLDEILTGAGPGDVFGPHVRGFDFDGGPIGTIGKVNFFAYSTLKYGANVASASIDADAYHEIVTGPGPGAVFAPSVRAFDYDAATLRAINKVHFNAFPDRHGVEVTAGDLDGDPYAEIAAGRGAGPLNPAELRGFTYDAATLAAIPGFDTTAFPSHYGIEVDAAELTGAAPGDVHCGPGPDPNVEAIHRAFFHDGTGLAPLGYSEMLPFDDFPGGSSFRYGLKVGSASH